MRHLGIAAVHVWRHTLGALFPASCKYHPSCSQYAIDALRRHGLLAGSLRAGWRLLRCNPWSHGGFDPVDGTGTRSSPTDSLLPRGSRPNVSAGQSPAPPPPAPGAAS